MKATHLIHSFQKAGLPDYYISLWGILAKIVYATHFCHSTGIIPPHPILLPYLTLCFALNQGLNPTGTLAGLYLSG